MKKDLPAHVLYEDENHKFVWLGADAENEENVIQTNQYLIVNRGKGVLIDPGGVHLFSRVISAVSKFISLDDIETVFFSHQDPDVSSGIALWMGVTPAKIYISELWTRFIPHFGIVDWKRLVTIEETGYSHDLSGSSLLFIPSHFLHSAGCYSLYDTASKILFSGDIGTAVFEDRQYLFADDFESHLKLIDSFHRRYMCSSMVLKKWISIVSKNEIDMIAPQHGAVYRGDSVPKLFEYLGSLKCGIDNIDELYKQ